MLGSSAITASVVYSLFIDPILQYTSLAVLCQPAVLFPNMILNYFLYTEFKMMMHAKRDMVINMWLMPLGKQVLVETYNGDIRKVNIKDFYKFETRTTRFGFGNRLEMYHGANNFLFLQGDVQYMDREVIDSIIAKTFIDTKNVFYDFDFDKAFTWEVDELMKSDVKKKYCRMHNKFLNPIEEEDRKDDFKKFKGKLGPHTHRLILPTAITKVKKSLKPSRYVKSLNHNMSKTWKSYNILRKWANFNLAKMQGSTIDFTEEIGEIKTFDKVKAHPDDQVHLDEKLQKKQDFVNGRVRLLRRPSSAKIMN